MRFSNANTRGRGLLIAGFALALIVVGACGSSSKSTTTQPSTTKKSTKPGDTTSGAGTTQAGSAHVDLTASGGVRFHITGTKADCNGLGDGVDLTAADYPEVGKNLNIGAINGGAFFKWLFDNSVIYSDTSTTAGVTITTQPFKVVLKGTKLVAAVPVGTPAKPAVMLTGTITCPS